MSATRVAQIEQGHARRVPWEELAEPLALGRREADDERPAFIIAERSLNGPRPFTVTSSSGPAAERLPIIFGADFAEKMAATVRDYLPVAIAHHTVALPCWRDYLLELARRTFGRDVDFAAAVLLVDGAAAGAAEWAVKPGAIWTVGAMVVHRYVQLIDAKAWEAEWEEFDDVRSEWEGA